MPLNVVMLGAPGAGKGTQAERLAERERVPQISTGDILREAVARQTDLGRAAQAVMDEGHLVGDDIMIALVRERLSRPDCADGFVLDGFPRTVAQAEALDGIVSGRGPLMVLFIDVPAGELVRRLATRMVCRQCGHNMAPELKPSDPCDRCGGAFVQRADDNAQVVLERLKVFAEQTEPLIAHYRARPAFVEIDGHQPAARVAEAIRLALAGWSAAAGDARRA